MLNRNGSTDADCEVGVDVHQMDGMDNFFSGKGLLSVGWVSEGNSFFIFVRIKKLT